MKNKFIKRRTLMMVCWLIFLGLPSWAVEEAIQEQADTTINQKSSTIKHRVLHKTESGVRKVLKFVPGGEAMGDILYGSSAEKTLAVQEEILATNQNTCSQIKAMSKNAMSLKRKFEEMDRLKKASVRLGQHFSKSSYSKMFLALSEQALRISCNPSDYIPNTAYTRKLKRNLAVRYGQEKRFLQGSQRFLKSSTKALSLKAKSYKDTQAFQKKLIQATAYDRHVEEYVAAKNFLLAQEHEVLATSLLKSNQKLQAMIHDKKAHMSAAKVIQIQHMINKNVSKALCHKAKANDLLTESSKITQVDQEKLAALEAHAVTQELIAQELKALQNREQPSWIGSKQKGRKKSFKKKQQ